VRSIPIAHVIGRKNSPTGADFQLRASQEHAKQPIILNGWVAEWFKAPVLKAEYPNPDASLIVSPCRLFPEVSGRPLVSRPAHYRLIPRCPVPISVPSFTRVTIAGVR
jgi:hypothetical protein